MSKKAGHQALAPQSGSRVAYVHTREHLDSIKTNQHTVLLLKAYCAGFPTPLSGNIQVLTQQICEEPTMSR